ncbi:30S ribosomal protein S4 [Candidatus Nomurabacteria bacterium]|nr:30S ribosomal protein S4 [Candidatus Kaiserbacteria bacterium]MCB9810471.1 30S ribosomal protein S4 [Candidatus Nomurabacteria bacterium]MCB9818200.1 30S ribosomal protein S4 [Candidatus Nomurabacteria bacterium]
MKIGPKFKIAKRLGAPIFEKTQSQKFELSLSRRSNQRQNRRPGQASDYKKQLIEKQKLRFTYGISEKQLRRYHDDAVEKSNQPVAVMMERIESRLDSVIYRMGLAKTRRLARQIASHGHICVNGKKMTIPSHKVKVGDVISIREGSRQTGLFIDLKEKHEAAALPAWVTFDVKKMEGVMKSVPVFNPAESLFDPEQVMEYYSR